MAKIDISLFGLDPASADPKYIQLADAITDQITRGNLSLGDKLPSVNTFSSELEMSRETVFKALNLLSKKGVIKSLNRRGYFIQSTDVDIHLRVFIMLDKLTAFKEDIFQTLYSRISDFGEVDIFFHHHNFNLFQKLITENLQNYTHFVVVTFLKEDPKPVLDQIPAEKGIILDCYEPELKKGLSMIYQDFAQDVFDTLVEAEQLLHKYHKIILVAPNHLHHGDKVKRGFLKFCTEFEKSGTIIEQISDHPFKKGQAYITVQANDVDDVQIIKLARARGYNIGKDIGIVSYNDTPVKEILEGGITVISTDFKKMGMGAAKLILNKEVKTLVNPSKLIVRNSL